MNAYCTSVYDDRKKEMERNFSPQRKAVFDYVSHNSFWFRNSSKLDQTKKNEWLLFALSSMCSFQQQNLIIIHAALHIVRLYS